MCTQGITKRISLTWSHHARTQLRLNHGLRFLFANSNLSLDSTAHWGIPMRATVAEVVITTRSALCRKGQGEKVKPHLSTVISVTPATGGGWCCT